MNIDYKSMRERRKLDKLLAEIKSAWGGGTPLAKASENGKSTNRSQPSSQQKSPTKAQHEAYQRHYRAATAGISAVERIQLILHHMCNRELAKHAAELPAGQQSELDQHRYRQFKHLCNQYNGARLAMQVAEKLPADLSAPVIAGLKQRRSELEQQINQLLQSFNRADEHA